MSNHRSMVRVEFMPGRVAEVPAMTVAGLPKYVVCRLAKQSNGSYALIPESWHQMVPLTRTLHKELGLNCSYRTLYNLVRAGFVRGSMPTSGLTLIDLASVAEHLRNCEVSEDKPLFWTKDRKDRYRWAAAGSASAAAAQGAYGACEDDDTEEG